MGSPKDRLLPSRVRSRVIRAPPFLYQHCLFLRGQALHCWLMISERSAPTFPDVDGF